MAPRLRVVCASANPDKVAEIVRCKRWLQQLWHLREDSPLKAHLGNLLGRSTLGKACLAAATPEEGIAVAKAAEDAAARTKAQLAAQAGYGSTNPTGGQGVTTLASTSYKTLLGQ